MQFSRKYYGLLCAILFLALQGLVFTHGSEFGFDPHSHDGVACATHIVLEEHAHTLSGADTYNTPKHFTRPYTYASNRYVVSHHISPHSTRVRAPPLHSKDYT